MIGSLGATEHSNKTSTAVIGMTQGERMLAQDYF